MRNTKLATVERQIIAVQRSGANRECRELVEEICYQIYMGSAFVGRVSCSPWNVRQAVIGWLFLNGYIRCAKDIHSMEILENSCEIHIDAASSDSTTIRYAPSADYVVSAHEIFYLSSLLEERSQLFRRTGGVHSAALAHDGKIMVYEEDVSRHAAVDKVIGACLLDEISLADGILLFSGRIPGEIIRKMDAIGCKMIIARSAPTEYACQLAEAGNISVIGFARDDSFNIYTCPHRITDLNLQ